MTSTGTARSPKLHELLRRADHVLHVLQRIGDVPAGLEGADLDRVLAVGGMAVVFRGRTTSGVRVAAKVPVEFVSHWEELAREDLRPVLAQAWKRLQEEAGWLDRLEETGLFPRKLFPPHGQSVGFPAGNPEFPLLVLQWGVGLPLRQALGMVASSRSLLRLQSEALRGARTLVVARWMEGVLEGLRRILHDHGGVYTDVAPDNFLVQAEGGPVVFLDAGAIVPVGTAEPVQLRPNYVPTAFQGRVRSLARGGGAELERVLAGMVAKLFASGLAGELPSPEEDPVAVWLAARLPLDRCFYEVLAACLSRRGSGDLGTALKDLRACIRKLEDFGAASGRRSIWRQVGGAEQPAGERGRLP